MNYRIEELMYKENILSTTPIVKIHNADRQTAIIVHVFYLDVWHEIVSYLETLNLEYDLYITISETIADIHIVDIMQQFPDAHLYRVENRGRDVLPFLQILNLIGEVNYSYLCKLHTKKSVEIDNGDAWRKLLYYDLIGSEEIVQDTLHRFQENNALGIISGKNLILDGMKFDLGNSEKVKHLAQLTHIPFVANYHFAAGTMFWMRFSLLEPLLSVIEGDDLVFEEEFGQTDHTLAHAMERFFGLLCESQGYRLEESHANYTKLDAKTLDDLAVLAFTQRFKYDMLIHSKNLHIHEKDEMLHTLLTSKSYRFTKPFRHMEFLFKTLLHFKLAKINSHGTNEHKLAMAIKRRIPEHLFLAVKSIIKRKTLRTKQDAFWDVPLTDISKDKGKNILIIAELSIPQCKKYRVDQKVEMFSLLGYGAEMISWTEYQKARNLLQLSSLVFFYRVPAEESVLRLVDEAKRLGLTTLFDVDDLIFDEALLKTNINIQNLPPKIQAQVFSGAKTYKKAMSSMDYCSASTTVLAQYMHKHTEHETFVIPNALDEELLQASKLKKIEKYTSTIKIVYGSGTSTHDVDFQEVSAALEEILAKYPHVHLIIHGTLTLPESFKTFTGQIHTIPFMKASEYYTALNSYDINIAPLEPSIFNDAKSNIKYLEASVVRMPTIASDVVEYKAIIEDGINGFIAGNKEEWITAFEKLIGYETLRKTMGEAAYDTVMKGYKPNVIAKEYVNPILEKFIPKKDADVQKVLMANVLFHPTSFGGATIVVEELAKRINAHKHFDVTIVTAFFDVNNHLYEDYDIVRYEAHGLPVILIRLPEPMLSTLEYHNPKMEEVFSNILQATQPDIVHFHAIQQLSASLANACIKQHIPHIITLHDMWWVCEKQFMIMPNGKYCHQTKIDTSFCQVHCNYKDDKFTTERTQYLKNILENADILLTPSTFQKEMYAYNIQNKEKLHVNKNGILFPAESYAKKSNAQVRFAFVGGNADHKGYAFIKQIFESIEETHYELVIVDINRKLGYDSMFDSDWDIKGTLTIVDGYKNTQEGLDNFFSDIDVLLFPSQCKESFGLTVREALVRDVWVMSTNAGGVEEDIVEGENGNIIDMQDNIAFKDTIERYINTFNPENAYENTHKNEIRTYDTQAKELMAYYQDILDKR